MKADASRCCVFCGSPADSKEHVFAKRLCKRAGAVKYPVIAGLSVEGQENITRNEHQIESVQVRHVCTTCNNTWMNDLEEWFELRLGFLIEPQWPQLALPMIEALKSERNKLAQWLMKTAVIFSLASLQGEHPVEFSPTVTQKIKDGILPKDCWTDLAFSKSVSSAVGGMITRCFYVKNGAQPIQSQVIKNGDGFKFIRNCPLRIRNSKIDSLAAIRDDLAAWNLTNIFGIFYGRSSIIGLAMRQAELLRLSFGFGWVGRRRP
jgi:hypothetical protein